MALRYFYPLLVFVILFFSCNSVPEGYTKTSFKVYGNCGMCKKTIEGSLKKEGVSSAEWDKKTKMIEVVFNPTLISLDSIHGSIAAAGYDTEMKRGNDSAYGQLHSCCKYDRRP